MKRSVREEIVIVSIKLMVNFMTVALYWGFIGTYYPVDKLFGIDLDYSLVLRNFILVVPIFGRATYTYT